jgi:hypothetical protein
MMAKCSQNIKKDPYIRNHFYKLQREYNKTRKQTYREYKKSLLISWKPYIQTIQNYTRISKLSKLENSTNFNELDFSIKESEISRTPAHILGYLPDERHALNICLRLGSRIDCPFFSMLFEILSRPGYLVNLSLASVLEISLSLIEKSSSLKFVEFSNFDNVC